jgi:Archaeal holliday junction resolvase (hjc)
MKGGKASRDKGNRAERAIVKFLQDRGFAAERVPLSGSAGGSYLGDLTVPILNIDRVVEVKVRAKGFSQLYDWLIDRDILIVRADRSEPLVVLPLKLAAEIAEKAGACPAELPRAISAAAAAKLRRPAEYIRAAIFARLQDDGIAIGTPQPDRT